MPERKSPFEKCLLGTIKGQLQCTTLPLQYFPCTLWDGEWLECGCNGIWRISVEGGRVIVPEDVELAWMSVC